MKENKRKAPIENFDWDKLEREDKKNKSKKKSFKPVKKSKRPLDWIDEEEDDFYLTPVNAEDEDIKKEMELLSDEEKELPYPDHFLADINSMLKSIDKDEINNIDEEDEDAR
jgi:hypothetical protein